MNIKPIKGFNSITGSKITNKQSEKLDPETKTDMASISDQARIMNSSSKIDKLNKIKELIKNKQYESDEKLRSVAGEILKEINSTNKK